MARNTIASDTFDSSIDGNWDNGQGDFGALTWVSGGHLESTTSGTSDAAMRRNVGTYPRKQWSKVETSALATTGGSQNAQIAALVLCASGATDESCYAAYLGISTSGGNKYEIFEVNASFGYTSLAASGTPPSSLSAGDFVSLESDGAGLLTLYTSEGGGAETSRLTANDSTLTSGRPGLLLWHTNPPTTPNARITAWEGGDFPGTAALTGTATATIDEADIVAGGKTIIATLTDETYVPASVIGDVSFIANALGGTTTTTSFSITLPATQAGDIIILEFAHRGTGNGTIGGTYTGPAFTLKHSQLFGSSAFSGKTYWSRATGNHAGETVTGSSLTNSCAAILTQYRGALASGDPLADATIVGEQNASGNETQAEITTATDKAWVVLVVVNSPDLAVATQACTSPGTLTERAEVLSTGGTDSSIAHASAVKATAGATGALTWTQTDAASGSWAYAIKPNVTTPFADARQAFINGFDSAQSEGTGWDAEVKAKAAVTEVVRTSDTVVTWTIAAQAGYDITAQEVITGTIPGSILTGGSPIVATPTFTIDPEAAGTLFFQDVSGALSFAGALVRRTNKTLTGATSFSGSLNRLTTRTLVGALSFSGALTKMASRALIAVLSFVGNSSASKVSLKLLTGDLSFAGDLRRVVPKQITGVLSFAGGLVKGVPKNLSASVSFAGALTKQVLRSLVGSLSFAGSLSRSVSKSLSGSVSFAGVESGVKVAVKTITGALSFAGTLARHSSKSLAGVLSFSGTLARQKSQALTGALSFTGALAKSTFKSLSGAGSFSGILSGTKVAVKALAGSISFIGVLSKVSAKILVGVLSFSGALAKQVSKTFTGAISFAGDLTKRMNKSLTGALSFIGSLATLASKFKVVTGALSFAGNLTRRVEKSLTGVISFSGTLLKSMGKSLTASVTFVGEMRKLTAKNFLGALSFVGSLTAQTVGVIVKYVERTVLFAVSWMRTALFTKVATRIVKFTRNKPNDVEF
jgi:hypothetical protein